MFIYIYMAIHHRFSDVIYVKLFIDAVIEVMFGVWKCETITLALKKGVKTSKDQILYCSTDF